MRSMCNKKNTVNFKGKHKNPDKFRTVGYSLLFEENIGNECIEF